MYDSSDSNAGSEGTEGTERNAGGNSMTSEMARTFAGGAKSGGDLVVRRPWDDYDPKAKPDPKRPFSLRLNEYDKAIARQLATWRQTSMQQAIVDVLREAALREIKAEERRQPRKRKAG